MEYAADAAGERGGLGLVSGLARVEVGDGDDLVAVLATETAIG